MPGLLLCFVLRFDNHKRRMNEGVEKSKVTYFHCSLIGYFVGMLKTVIVIFSIRIINYNKLPCH